MTYRVEISPTAIHDIENIFLWLKLNAPEKSYRWVRGCYEIMLKLESFPSRCPLALESEYLDLEIRQLLYEKKYRILFSIVEDENTRMVKIHRVRHSSQIINFISCPIEQALQRFVCSKDFSPDNRRTKVLTTNHFYYGNRPDMISLTK